MKNIVFRYCFDRANRLWILERKLWRHRPAQPPRKPSKTAVKGLYFETNRVKSSPRRKRRQASGQSSLDPGSFKPMRFLKKKYRSC